MSASNGLLDIAAVLRSAEDAAVWERASDLAVIEARGADREKWLNGLVTCDISKMTSGTVSYGLVVGRTGKMQADVRVVRDQERLLLVVPASVRADLLATFERHLIMEDVELAPLSLETWIGTGPQTSATAAVLAKQSGVSGASWDRTGSGGCIAFSDPSRPLPDVAVINEEAARAIRLRHGIAKWGDDFDTTLYPHEASLEKVAVAFDKGCYLGQEVVCMVELRGQVKRKLALIEGAAPMNPGDRVLSLENADIGEVRTAALTPDGARAIALLKVASSATDTELRIAGDSGHSARVLKLCGRA